MPVGVLTLEIQLPYAHSLKEKRAVLRKMRDRLRVALQRGRGRVEPRRRLAARHAWEWSRSPTASRCWNPFSARSWPSRKKSWVRTWRIISWSFSESRESRVKSSRVKNRAAGTLKLWTFDSRLSTLVF